MSLIYTPSSLLGNTGTSQILQALFEFFPWLIVMVEACLSWYGNRSVLYLLSRLVWKISAPAFDFYPDNTHQIMEYKVGVVGVLGFSTQDWTSLFLMCSFNTCACLEGWTFNRLYLVLNLQGLDHLFLTISGLWGSCEKESLTIYLTRLSILSSARSPFRLMPWANYWSVEFY